MLAEKNAKNFLIMGLDIDMVAKGTGLSVEEVRKIKKELNQQKSQSMTKLGRERFIKM